MPNGPQETNCSIRPQSYKSFKHICPGTFLLINDLVSKCLMSRLNLRICWSRQVRVQPWAESVCCVFWQRQCLFLHMNLIGNILGTFLENRQNAGGRGGPPVMD